MSGKLTTGLQTMHGGPIQQVWRNPTGPLAQWERIVLTIESNQKFQVCFGFLTRFHGKNDKLQILVTDELKMKELWSLIKKQKQTDLQGLSRTETSSGY